MKQIKYLFFVLVFVVNVFLFINTVYAADLEVTCSTGSCDLSSSSPLFSALNVVPNWKATKVVKAINNYAEDRNFALSINNTINWKKL